MKYKVGDTVRINSKDGASSYMVGCTAKVSRVVRSEFYAYHLEGYCDRFCEKELDLVKRGKTTMRRTFRALKDGPEFKKGALFQEACDDGDQEYKLLDEDHMSEAASSDWGDYYSGDLTLTRNTVEDQPKWFEEVFPISDEYVTKDELSAFRKFKLSLTKKAKK